MRKCSFWERVLRIDAIFLKLLRNLLDLASFEEHLEVCCAIFTLLALFNTCCAVGCVATHLAEYKPKPVRLLVSRVRSQLVGTLLASCAQSFLPSSPPLLSLIFFRLFLGFLLEGLDCIVWVVLQDGSVGCAFAFTFRKGYPAQVPLCLGRQHAGTRDSKRRQNHRSLSSPPFFEMFGRENRLPTHHFFAYPRFLFVHLGSWAFERVGALPSICRILCKTVI